MATLTFDPITEDSGNTPLEIYNSPDGAIRVLTMDFPAPPLETVTAGSIDTDGDQITARRHQNRQISLSLDLVEPALAAATNLVTTPSFETGIGGWSTSGSNLNSGATTTTVQGGACSGDYALSVTTGGGTVNRGITFSLGSLAAGTYVISVALKGAAGGEALQVYAGATSGPTKLFDSTVSTDWQVVTGTFTTTATTCQLMVRNPGTTTATVYVDAALVTAGATVGPYFDGDSPGCSWSGTVYASTSLRPAADGTRFRAMQTELQTKVAKLATDGGTLRWVNDGGDVRTFDVLASDGYQTSFQYLGWQGRATSAQMTLIAKPYARGAEVTLGSHSETSLSTLTFTDTITGDVPATGRLVVTEAQAAKQGWAVWGMRSRNYSASAPLIYPGESCTLKTGVASGSLTGAVGGSAAIATLASLSAPDNHKLIDVTSGGSLALVGTYHVYARVKIANAYSSPTMSGTGATTKVYLGWKPPTGGGEAINQAATVDTTQSNQFVIVDLGLVRFPQVVMGPQVSIASIYANPMAAFVAIDDVWMVPADDGFGVVSGTNALGALEASKTLVIRSDGVLVQNGTTTYTVPVLYEGDYLRVTPNETVQVLVKASRGAGPFIGFGGVDTNIDDISARLTYTPRYLTVN